ncbi:uncharacterized protein V6R79_013500 [Siganus canaliculatus]
MATVTRQCQEVPPQRTVKEEVLLTVWECLTMTFVSSRFMFRFSVPGFDITTEMPKIIRVVALCARNAKAPLNLQGYVNVSIT